MAHPAVTAPVDYPALGAGVRLIVEVIDLSAGTDLRYLIELPSAEGIIVPLPPSITAAAVLEVPKSIPIIFAIITSPYKFNLLLPRAAFILPRIARP